MPSIYLRFVVAELDEDSQRELGVFHAMRKLQDEGKLTSYEQEQYDLIREWFNRNLERPTRFTRSKPPYYRKINKAISWFKDSAQEHLSQIRALSSILESHGVFVHMLKTERIGYVVYEDEYQIVAEPFAGEA